MMQRVRVRNPSHSVRGSLERLDMAPVQTPAWKCFTAGLEDEAGLRDFEVDTRGVNTVTCKAQLTKPPKNLELLLENDFIILK